MKSLARTICELNVLLDLDNLATRRLRRRRRTARTEFLVLARLFHTSNHRLAQVDLADMLQLSVSQVQKVTEELGKQSLVVREADAAPRGGVMVKLTDRGRKRLHSDVESGAKEFAVFDIVWETDEDRRVALEKLEQVAKFIRQHVEGTSSID